MSHGHKHLHGWNSFQPIINSSAPHYDKAALGVIEPDAFDWGEVDLSSILHTDCVGANVMVYAIDDIAGSYCQFYSKGSQLPLFNVIIHVANIGNWVTFTLNFPEEQIMYFRSSIDLADWGSLDIYFTAQYLK